MSGRVKILEIPKYEGQEWSKIANRITLKLVKSVTGLGQLNEFTAKRFCPHGGTYKHHPAVQNN